MFYVVLIVCGVALLPKTSAGNQDRLHIRVHVHNKYHTHTHDKVLYKPVYEKYYVPIFEKKEPSKYKGLSHFDQWSHGSTVNERVVKPRYNSSEDSGENFRWPMPLKWNTTVPQHDVSGTATHIVHHPVLPVQSARPVAKAYTGHAGHTVSYDYDNNQQKRQLGLDDYYLNGYVDDPYLNSSEEEEQFSSELREQEKPTRKGPSRILFRPVSNKVIRGRVKSNGKPKRSSKQRPSVFSFTVPN